MRAEFEVGDRVLVEGVARYWQDFATWEHDFGDGMIFRVDRITNGRLCLKAPGYGERGAYGSGAINIDPRYVTAIPQRRPSEVPV